MALYKKDFQNMRKDAVKRVASGKYRGIKSSLREIRLAKKELYARKCRR